jgi:hypothetical protein
MDAKISLEAREEVLQAVQERYRHATRKEKARILDEVIALTHCHRKHAIRLLAKAQKLEPQSTRVGKRVYDEAVREALIVIWEAADRICGKGLKAVLPALLKSLELHGHLQPTSVVRELLLSVSASTIDRLLAPIRSQARSRKKRRSKKKASKAVAIRTFADWNDPLPGFLEIDFVVHCGGTMAGTYIHIFGSRVKCVPPIDRRPPNHGIGELARTRLRRCGPRYSPGFRKIPRQQPSRYFNDCGKRTPSSSRVANSERCSVVSKNGVI